MLNTTTKNENKYRDLLSRSQRKDENVSETFAYVLHVSISHDEVSGSNFYNQTSWSNLCIQKYSSFFV